MKVLGMCLPYVKRYFQPDQSRFFYLGLDLLRLSCFWENPFGRDQRSQFNNYTFSKMFSAIIVYRYVPNLRKKVFSAASMTFFL